jgi:hypothetical protein
VDSKPNRDLENGSTTETNDSRRDAVRKLGKFAAYAAPFTVLALPKKAEALSGGTQARPHR